MTARNIIFHVTGSDKIRNGDIIKRVQWQPWILLNVNQVVVTRLSPKLLGLLCVLLVLSKPLIGLSHKLHQIL